MMRGVRIKRLSQASTHAPVGEVAEWSEDLVPPAALARAADAVVDDPKSARLSLLYAVADLRNNGLGTAEIGTLLGVSAASVRSVIADPRYTVVSKRVLIDKPLQDTLAQVQASYRMRRALEVLTGELDSKNEWLRHQAATFLVQDGRAAERAGQGQSVTIQVSAAMDFDDQSEDDLQDEIPDDARQADLTIYNAMRAQSDGQSMQ